ncbi:wax ester/triacylglycerol synthase family O-acyltransferase [Dactylosporangium sp. NPDC050688]|uniref:WS/DGAT/MGAT family O-acyltransferase n=1 Tax=Dactylosporangium sp. NPDC050688 TaxID=3157217 RepID=UPI0033CC77D5
MEHLSPLDSAFLDFEDADRHASLAIASIAVVEGPPPSQSEFVESVRGRLPLIARYRQKVRQLPLDVGPPVWVEDPAFDLTYHIRRTGLPAPGDDAALCRLVARLMAQRLDRDRPLWECWVIEGLAGNRWAVLTKVHHCMADGVSGNALYRIVFDESPVPRDAVPDTRCHTPEPSTLRLTADAVADLVGNPLQQIRSLMHALHAPQALVRHVADTARGLIELTGVLMPVSRSPLAGPIGQQRRYAVGRAALQDVVHVAKTFQVTVNDVVLAAVTGAFRTHLLNDGATPDPDAVRTLVPVSMRTPGDEGVVDNRISVLLPLLPVEHTDPVGRLREVHRRLSALKESKEAEAGEAMTELAKHEPFPPLAYGIRLAARLPQRHIVAVTTNVPGPRRPLYVLGRQIVEILPYVPIAVRLRTGVAALTYHGQMSFGVTTDYDTGPDADLIIDALGDEIAKLVEAARAADATARSPKTVATPRRGRAGKRATSPAAARRSP